MSTAMRDGDTFDTAATLLKRYLVYALFAVVAVAWFGWPATSTETSKASACATGDHRWERIGGPPAIYDNERGQTLLCPDKRIEVLDSGLAQGRGVAATAPGTLIVADAWEGLYEYKVLNGAVSNREQPRKLPNLEVCPDGQCVAVDHRGLVFNPPGADGHVLIADTNRQRLLLRATNDKPMARPRGWSATLEGVTDATLGGDDRLFVTAAPDRGPRPAGSLFEISATQRDKAPVRIATLEHPLGVGFDPCRERIYVADVTDRQISWVYFEHSGEQKWTRAVLASQPLPREVERPLLQDIAVARCSGKRDSASGGEVFAAGPDGLYVYDPEGTLIARYRLKQPVAGLTWGIGEEALYMTIGHRLARLRTGVRGAEIKSDLNPVQPRAVVTAAQGG